MMNIITSASPQQTYIQPKIIYQISWIYLFRVGRLLWDFIYIYVRCKTENALPEYNILVRLTLARIRTPRGCSLVMRKAICRRLFHVFIVHTQSQLKRYKIWHGRMRKCYAFEILWNPFAIHIWTNLYAYSAHPVYTIVRKK